MRLNLPLTDEESKRSSNMFAATSPYKYFFGGADSLGITFDDATQKGFTISGTFPDASSHDDYLGHGSFGKSLLNENADLCAIILV